MNTTFWSRLSGPTKVGITFFVIAVLLSVFGIVRNPETSVTVQSVLIATIISGFTWGIIAWAIATAALDVEEDIEERDGAAID